MLNATLKIAAGFFQQNPTKLRKKYTFPAFVVVENRELWAFWLSAKEVGFDATLGNINENIFLKMLHLPLKTSKTLTKSAIAALHALYSLQ